MTVVITTVTTNNNMPCFRLHREILKCLELVNPRVINPHSKSSGKILKFYTIFIFVDNHLHKARDKRNIGPFVSSLSIIYLFIDTIRIEEQEIERMPIQCVCFRKTLNLVKFAVFTTFRGNGLFPLNSLLSKTIPEDKSETSLLCNTYRKKRFVYTVLKV